MEWAYADELVILGFMAFTWWACFVTGRLQGRDDMLKRWWREHEEK